LGCALQIGYTKSRGVPSSLEGADFPVFPAESA
jgi:hypothetical protein